MLKQVFFVLSIGVIASLCVFFTDPSGSQEPPPFRSEAVPAPAAGTIPKGLEVQARGPIHEAFATPLTDPKGTPTIAKKPPLPIEEMPPEEKPDGDVIWIGGYFAWDDDRADFLWVSGCWRVKPAGKEWVPGYWREVSTNWQWVSGFWTTAHDDKTQGVTYYPEPPAPPKVAPAGDPPAADTFYIPGYWMWSGDHYVWRAGYWTRVVPGRVYVPSHYQWTPSGYVLVPGYWDLQMSRRGVLYAPVVIDPLTLEPGYVYSPYYAVRDTVVLDTLFVRPAFGVYYFGDYYGPRYVGIGFEPGVVYSRRYYEPLIVYERWDRRDNPRWFDAQITLVVDRGAGRAAVPPRVVNVTNVTVVNNFIAPTRTILAAQGQKTVTLSPAARTAVAANARATHQALAAERHNSERAAAAAGPLNRPQTSKLSVPPTSASGSPHMTAGTAGNTPAATTKTGTTDSAKSTIGGPTTDKKSSTLPPAKDSTKKSTKDTKSKTP